jgi:acyl-CoA thioester hydrolase
MTTTAPNDTTPSDTDLHRVHTSTLSVRGYEIDALGHVAGTVYMQYAEHARWECLAAAGLPVATLLGAGVMPVILEITLNYRTELRFGDDVEIGCEFHWGERKTARISQRISRGDGAVAAEVSVLCGLLDLTTRKLVASPRERLRELATDPDLLGV